MDKFKFVALHAIVLTVCLLFIQNAYCMANELPKMPTLAELGLDLARDFPNYKPTTPRPKNQFSPNKWGAVCDDCIEDLDDIPWDCPEKYRVPECEHIPTGYDGKSYISNLQRYVPYKRIMEWNNIAGMNLGHSRDEYDYNFGKNIVNELLDEIEPYFDFSAEGTRLGPSRYENKLFETDKIDTGEYLFDGKDKL